MREIKFRAWDKGAPYQCEVNGKLVTIAAHPCMVYRFNPISHGEINVLDLSFINEWGQGRYALMQYTGLKDKNGKEIYEGDIVECDQGRFVVAWDNDYSLYRFGSWAAADHPWPIEVLGNIYQNPELIPQS